MNHKIKETYETRSIYSIAIMVTDFCNQDCYHCFRTSILKKNFNIDKIQSLIKTIKPNTVNRVRLTGGEPFLIKGLDELIDGFGNIGIYTSIVTNGTLLNYQILNKLKESKLNALWFSIHSEDESIHDYLSGHQGSCRILKKVMKESVELGIETNVYFPINSINKCNIEKTLVWLNDIGIKKIKILKLINWGKFASPGSIKSIPGKDWGNLWTEMKIKLQLLNLSLEVQGLSQEAADVKNSQSGDCTVLPLKHINIDTFGNLYPCCILNGRKNYHIGHLDEILKGDWDNVIHNLEERTKRIYGQYIINRLPCQKKNTKNFLNCNRLCPLFTIAL